MGLLTLRMLGVLARAEKPVVRARMQAVPAKTQAVRAWTQVVRVWTQVAPARAALAAMAAPRRGVPVRMPDARARTNEAVKRVEGVGIGLRKAHYQELKSSEREIPWLEIVPENFLFHGGFRSDSLRFCAERWPLIPHGVSLSLGGPDPLDLHSLGALKELAGDLEAPYVSDHACFSSAHGISFHDLMPLPFCEEAALHMASRARQVMDYLELPLLLENISYYAVMPGSCLSEGEFLRIVLEESGAGLLLDVNNVYVNATNHGQDPVEALLQLPIERARQIHLAGHVKDGDYLLDNHGSEVSSEVWDLYRIALDRVGPLPTLIEWDTHVPALDLVLDEAQKANRILQRAKEAQTPKAAREGRVWELR